MKCSKCGKELGGLRDGSRIAFICGGVMGDEYIESYYRCGDCGAYTLEVYHDRFCGEGSVSVRGPLERKKAEKKMEIIGRCPKPWSKRCRCEAHIEYFGNILD